MSMRTPDFGHRLTDLELKALENRIAEEYRKAAEELTDKINDYFMSFEKRDAEQKALLDAGEITESYYKQWRLNQIGRGQRFERLRDHIAERITAANEAAVSYINDETPGIYTLNRNYAAYTIEHQLGKNIGFDLLDERTVKRMIVKQPDSMPYYPKEKALKRGIDLAYGKRQITAQVTSGILQGESINQLSNRLQTSIPTMNRNSAIRAARTAVTGAQNAGRLDSYMAAEKLGIKLKKEWLATLDGRTRHEHAMLDGQSVPGDEPFEVGGYKLMFPGDPSGAPEMIYNCRCTMVANLEDVDTSGWRRTRDPLTGESMVIKDMTYAEWTARRQAQIILENAKRQYGTDFTMSADDGILSKKDIYALYLYKSSHVSYPLNSILRGESVMTDEFRRIAHDIDQALLKLPTYQGTVYRSLCSQAMVDIDVFWEKYQPGKRVLEYAYTSSSTEVYDNSMDILMIIQSKTGRDIRTYNPSENEVLFRRGTMFYVEKKEGNVLWLTEI